MVEQGQFEPAAQTVLRQLADRDAPELRDFALRLAEAAERAGQGTLAVDLARAVADQGASPRALMQLSRMALARGDTATALAHLREALQLAPHAEDLLAAYGRVLLGNGSPAAAITPFEALMRMHPLEVQYPYLLGIAWMQVGDMVNAVEVLEVARSLEPERPLTLIALGLAFNNQKRYTEARDALRLALRYAPENIEALAALAESEAGLDNPAEGEALARRVLALGSDHSTANLVLGMVLFERGELAEARQALERSVAKSPSVKAHYQLSLVCARLGDREASKFHLDAYRKALGDREARVLAVRGQTPNQENP